MNAYLTWFGAMAVSASLSSARLHHPRTELPATGSSAPCTADSSYQRLAFWVGDWDVYDSTGAHYATQRVRSVIDECAIIAEWTGRVGDKGINISAYDPRLGEWKQVYVSNQVPDPLDIQIRKSDRSYNGPGLRFVSLLDPPAGKLDRVRITIMPSSEHRVMQLFETSSDGGVTWRTMFKAEFRQRQGH